MVLNNNLSHNWCPNTSSSLHFLKNFKTHYKNFALHSSVFQWVICMRPLKVLFLPFRVHSLLNLLCKWQSKTFEGSHGNYFSDLYHRTWNLRRNACHLEWAEFCTLKKAADTSRTRHSDSWNNTEHYLHNSCVGIRRHPFRVYHKRRVGTLPAWSIGMVDSVIG